MPPTLQHPNNIRPETPAEYEAVERLTYAAFSTLQKPGRVACDEHLLLHNMRTAAAFIPALSQVFVRDGHIAGHIAYTEGHILCANGKRCPVLTLGPVSVLPHYHRQGIGAALITQTLQQARALGHRAVVLTGHPTYYPKFGFASARHFGITLPDGSQPDALMALELTPGALAGCHGKWIYDPVFEVDADQLARFNAQHGYGR